MTPCRRTRGGDEGFTAIELAIVAPALLIVFGLVLAGMRVTVSGTQVEGAARDAARAASISRTSGQAHDAAVQAAHDSLAQQHVTCSGLAVDVSTDGFARPPGTAAAVTAQVRCTVELSDLVVPGLPGMHTMTASYTSSLDTYRARN